MVDYEATGIFIAQTRKDKGITQKELAEKLCVSPKTISKWETGRAIPDSVYLQDLAKNLEVTVVDILNGELTSDDDYKKVSEDIIISFAREKSDSRRDNILRASSAVVLLVLWALIAYIVFSMAQHFGIYDLSDAGLLLDIPTLIAFLIINLLVVVLAGAGKSIWEGILVTFGLQVEYEQKFKIARALKGGMITSIITGALMSLAIYIISNGTDPSEGTVLTYYRAVMFFPMVYSFVLVLLLLIVYIRVTNRKGYL